jgi:predicted Rossmann fold nucleotide-binding protein DprA/Smf involved in DNA uptake
MQIQRTTHVLIAGSRDASHEMLDYARRVVRRAHEKGYTVVVGDNPKGVDNAVVRECRPQKQDYKRSLSVKFWQK